MAENGCCGFRGAAGFTAAGAAALAGAFAGALGAALAAGFATALGTGFAAGFGAAAFTGAAFFGAAFLAVLAGAFFGAAFLAAVAGLVTFFDFVFLEGADFFETDLFTVVFFTFDLLLVFADAAVPTVAFFATGFPVAVFLGGAFFAAAFLLADLRALAAVLVEALAEVLAVLLAEVFAELLVAAWRAVAPFFASARRRVALFAPDVLFPDVLFAVAFAPVLVRAAAPDLVFAVPFLAVARAFERPRAGVFVFPLVLVLVFVAMIGPCIHK